MDYQDSINTIRSQMREQGVDLLLGFHDGGHFIEKPNAVMVLSGFKSMGPTMVILPCDGRATVVVSPAWDAERAAECSASVQAIGADDVAHALADYLARNPIPPSRVGTAGLASMPWPIEERMTALQQGEARGMERTVFGSARRKTADQIAKARTAAEIAEKGYEQLLRIARPARTVRRAGTAKAVSDPSRNNDCKIFLR